MNNESVNICVDLGKIHGVKIHGQIKLGQEILQSILAIVRVQLVHRFDTPRLEIQLQVMVAGKFGKCRQV